MQRKPCVLLPILLTGLLGQAFSTLSQSYSAQGDLYLSVTGGQFNRAIPSGTSPFVRDAATISGIPGNFARCEYLADLGRGALGLLAEGFAPKANLYDGGSAYVDASASMQDRLSFTLPAGPYPQPPRVVLRGWFYVAMQAAGSDASSLPRRSNVQTTAQVYLGGTSGNTNFSWLKHIYADEAAYAQVSEIVLSVPLLPGNVTNLSESLTVFLSFTASIQTRGTGLNTFPVGDAETSFLSDLWNSIILTALETPPGVTTDSASGVFMTQPGQAPGPLRIRKIADSVVVSWDGPGNLQHSPTPLGDWQNLSSATSPFTNSVAGAPQFYRLVLS